MSSDDPLDPPLDDPREEQVRRLLTDARHADPVPVDVAARLDRVLAQLADGRHDEPLPELAARRRRRAAGLLAAAAAVVVVGGGLGQVLPGTGGLVAGGDSGSTTAAEDGTRLTDESAGGGAGGTAERSTADQAQPPAQQDGVLDLSPVEEPLVVRAERFAADALRARDRIDSRSGSAASGRSSEPGTGASGRSQPFFACEPADWGTGVVVPVLYDERPHVLAFRAPAGESQVVDLLECGTGDVLRSTTLPAG